MTLGSYVGLGSIVIIGALFAVVLYDAITLLLGFNTLEVHHKGIGSYDGTRDVNPIHGYSLDRREYHTNPRDMLAFAFAILLAALTIIVLCIGVLAGIGLVASEIHTALF